MAGICSDFGPEYTRRLVEEGRPPTELWRALGSRGYRVNIPEYGGNGFALDYGLAQLWWGARVTRTAPGSREMILNYVVEHSLGLPRSYGPGSDE